MEPTVLEQTFKKARIIALAIMASVFIYIGLGEVFLAPHVDISLPNLDIFRIALYIISGIEAGIILWLRKILLKKTTPMPPAIMEKMKQRVQATDRPADEKEMMLSQRLLTTTVIGYALSESIAIYGLVLFLLGKQRQDLYLLAGLSLILMALFFPRFEDWKSRLDESRRNGQNHYIK